LRQHQQKRGIELETLEAIKIDPRLETLFIEILTIFKEHQINLIVNEYTDAPFTYKIEKNKAIQHQYLTKIKSIVESNGFTYIKPDMSSFKDEDYFDHNHLNHIGSEKYSTLLGHTLKGLL